MYWISSYLKIKGSINSKLKPLYTAIVHSTKLSEYRIEMKFDKDPLVIKRLLDQNYKCLHCLWFRCLGKKSY